MRPLASLASFSNVAMVSFFCSVGIFYSLERRILNSGGQNGFIQKSSFKDDTHLRSNPYRASGDERNISLRMAGDSRRPARPWLIIAPVHRTAKHARAEVRR